MTMKPAFFGACILTCVSLLPSSADAVTSGDLRLFSISKSENRNQVVYAVRVDEACRPAGQSPVHAYWQNLEVGPNAESPLLFIEQPAYGLASQEALSGDAVKVRLRALPDRPIVVHTQHTESGCMATATATVSSRPVALYNVYARLRRIFGVESVTISGREAGGAIVQEVVRK
jgi:hypothetical protein